MAIKVGTNNSQPLIPDIDGITKAVRDALTNCKECGRLLKILDDHFSKDDRSDVNVELMLNHIRSLRSVAGNDSVRGLSAVDLDKLDEKICQVIHELADKTLPNSDTAYHRIASWVGAVRRENPVEIFTTNYDLLMEQAFEDHRVPYFDGFAGSRQPFFDIRAMEEDSLPPRWARLWKLHGSINWYQVPSKGVLRVATTKEDGLKRVIHPSHLKYEESRRMPYLAMIDRLRAFLKQPTAVIVICGYSFRDEHINEVLVQGLQATQTAIAFALLFDEIAKYPQAVRLAGERSNLSLLARDGAVISGSEVKWLEKDAESVSEDSGRWVLWRSIDSNDKAKWIAEFKLGDFAVFGEFLSELTGIASQHAEVPNVK